MRRIVAFITLLIALTLFSSNATFYTYTLTKNNQWKKTQDAYLVSKILFKDFDLYYPEDMFIKDDLLYIVDSGNYRLVVYNLRTNEIRTLGENVFFMTPKGIFVDDNYIYVADPGAEAVFVLDKDGNEVKQIKRPESILFGETANYKPSNIVVDKKGNLYVVSEGTFEGVIQLSKDGEFLGYFGANRVILSFLQKFQDIFFTEEQKAKLLFRVPTPYTNSAIDEKGLIYTLTRGTYGNAIKKHNTIGNNILEASQNRKIADEPNFSDITVAKDGRIIAVTDSGLIYEYDKEGNLIYSYGGRAISSERNGLFTYVSSVAIDDKNNIYVLDRERGLVHVLTPTQYAKILREALLLYSDGKYLESMEKWKEVLRYDGYSKIAHLGLGKAYFQRGEYEKAILHFKVADEKADYSDAFWEIRNRYLQKNVGFILLLVVVSYALTEIISYINRKFNEGKSKRYKKNLLNDVLYIFTFLRHPIDSIYYIRRKERTSNFSATIVYGLFFLTAVLDTFGKSYIFSGYVERSTIGYVFLVTILPTMLWVFANYLVGSISDGEGTLSQVYRATAYALSPYIVVIPFLVLLTYVLTFNEVFIVQFTYLFVYSWMAINIFITVKEIHDFTVPKTIKSILLTIFWIIIIVFTASLVYMLWDKFFELIYSIVLEVIYRVR